MAAENTISFLGDIMQNKPFKKEVAIQINKEQLKGHIVIPGNSKAIILFAHGSGSSRFSPRNQYVAGVLNKAELSTLLFDLLTEKEEAVDSATGALRFDIDLLGYRLVKATEWVLQNPETKNLKIGYFGASTGSAAALIAAAEHPEWIYAIVSRGGRPDMAKDSLSWVVTPTLLIVGEQDQKVLKLNKDALKLMPPKTKKHLEIVPKATHLFEETGTLEQVAAKARDWFITYI